MNKKVNTRKLDIFEPGASFPVTDKGAPGVAGAGVADILFYLKTAERRTIKQLANMNNNGATDLQKQMMALALTEMDSAIEDLMEAKDVN